MIAAELTTGSFSIAQFYLRRARRILPAFFAVSAGTYALALALLLPGELGALGREVLAASLFSSNFLFWSEAGYFDRAAELKPFLHTWSLSVEEQFYLLWPLALALLFRKRIQTERAVVPLIALSFLLSCWWAVSAPAAAFFLLPSRIWELLLGAMLALRPAPAWLLRHRNAASWAGFLLILAAAATLGANSHWPAWNALFPCLGTFLLIAAGPDASCNRTILSYRPLVCVGLISYSLYLWHWPLLAIGRTYTISDLPGLAVALLMLVAFLLSAFTWKYVEQPFRRRRGTSTAAALIRYAAGLSVLLAVGLVEHELRALPDRAPVSAAIAEAARQDINPKRLLCHLAEDEVLRWDPRCTAEPAGAARGTFVVWGDSHADATAPGLVNRLNGIGYRVHQSSKTTCPPLVGVTPVVDGRRYGECADFNRAMLDWIIDDPSVVGVVLAARWPAYIDQKAFGARERDTTSARFVLTTAHHPQSKPAEAADIVAERLVELVRDLRGAGKQVIIIGSIPEHWLDVPACLARRATGARAGVDCVEDLPAARRRGITADDVLQKVASSERDVCLFLPRRLLCSRRTCAVETDRGMPAYYDDNHLSVQGALWLAEEVRERCLH
jgi:peptidoglycan/LPS O-acetylase OafA/YrhL